MSLSSRSSAWHSARKASPRARIPLRPASTSKASRLSLFDPNQCLAAVFAVIGNVMERVMSTYEVSFFKYLLSYDGHPFKCLKRRIDVSDAESTAQAEESASRAFEALCGYPWKLRADSIEVTRGRWPKP